MLIDFSLNDVNSDDFPEESLSSVRQRILEENARSHIIQLDDPALKQVLDDQIERIWWVEEDLNLRPHAYQACALTT